MPEIKILVEGYAKKLENGWVASSTSCLISCGDKKIITDPGCNREKLLEALKKENLKTGDFDFVFLSHCHPDHIILGGIFENAKFITFDDNLVFNKDLMTEFDKNILGEDIEIIETPGHEAEHLSLLVNTLEGKVAIAGDVFWWTDDREQILDLNQIDQSQAEGMSMETLVESRKKLLALADYIIPGHGKIFKVNK